VGKETKQKVILLPLSKWYIYKENRMNSNCRQCTHMVYAKSGNRIISRQCRQPASCRIGCDKVCFLHGLHLNGTCREIGLDAIIDLVERQQQTGKTTLEVMKSGNELSPDEIQDFENTIKRATAQLQILQKTREDLKKIQAEI